MIQGQLWGLSGVGERESTQRVVVPDRVEGQRLAASPAQVRFSRRTFGFVASLALWAVLVGCDRGPQLIPAKGVLTYRAEPVPNADIVFIPDAGGSPVIGRTGDTGEFSLSTNGEDGAYVGSYRVAVTAVKLKREVSEAEAVSMTTEQINANHVALVPVKYNNPISSGLTAVVSDDPAANDFKFELK